MKQLIYTSRATQAFQRDDLLQILTASRHNNAEFNVTGLLLYDARLFCQCLEGDEKDVNYTYNKIAADPRHGDVRLLMQRSVEERDFSEWWMGYVDAANPAIKALLENHDTGTGFPGLPDIGMNQLELLKQSRQFVTAL